MLLEVQVELRQIVTNATERMTVQDDSMTVQYVQSLALAWAWVLQSPQKAGLGNPDDEIDGRPRSR